MLNDIWNAAAEMNAFTFENCSSITPTHSDA